MARRSFRPRTRRRYRTRAPRWLLWLLILLGILLILALALGGFRKGTRADGGFVPVRPAGVGTLAAGPPLARR